MIKPFSSPNGPTEPPSDLSAGELFKILEENVREHLPWAVDRLSPKKDVQHLSWLLEQADFESIRCLIEVGCPRWLTVRQIGIKSPQPTGRVLFTWWSELSQHFEYDMRLQRYGIVLDGEEPDPTAPIGHKISARKVKRSGIAAPPLYLVKTRHTTMSRHDLIHGSFFGSEDRDYSPVYEERLRREAAGEETHGN